MANFQGMFPNQDDWRDHQTARGLRSLAPRPQQRPDPVNPASKVAPQRYRRPAGGGMTPQNPLSGGARQTGMTPSNRAVSAQQSAAQAQQFQGRRPPGSLAEMEAALSQQPDFQALGQESGYSPRGFGEFLGEIGRRTGLGAVRGAQGIADYWQDITTPKNNYQRTIGPRGMSEQNLAGVYGQGQPQQGAQRDAGAVRPPVVEQQPQQPPPRSFRDNPAMASTQPSMDPQQTRSLALQSAQSQSPIGIARQVGQVDGQPRTRYLGQNGYAEFQGTPAQQPGGFGGAATNAQAAATLADYRSRGLDQYGNDMQGIGRLNATADRMRDANQEQLQSLRASREANAREGELIGLRGAIQRAGFSDVEDDQRAGKLAERRLAQLGAISPQQDLYNAQQGFALQRQGLQQQGRQAQTQQQAATEQQAFENTIARSQQVVAERLASAELNETQRKAIADNPFSEQSIASVLQAFGEDALDESWRPRLAGYFMSLGGGYDPATGAVYNPAEMAELSPQVIERIRAFALGQPQEE